jgi:hypothetical protein
MRLRVVTTHGDYESEEWLTPQGGELDLSGVCTRYAEGLVRDGFLRFTAANGTEVALNREHVGAIEAIPQKRQAPFPTIS